MIAAAMAALSLVLLVSLAVALRRRVRRRFLAKLELAVDQHFAQLVRVRADSNCYGADGRLDSAEWRQEIERFLDAQVSPRMTPSESKRLEAGRRDFAEFVAQRVAAGVAGFPVYR